MYTQNIDGLYQKAGVNPSLVVEWHGSLARKDIVLYGDPISPACMKQAQRDFVLGDQHIDLLLGLQSRFIAS